MLVRSSDVPEESQFRLVPLRVLAYAARPWVVAVFMDEFTVVASRERNK
jgi:hypothetical protein